jgi:hypothetical protein
MLPNRVALYLTAFGDLLAGLAPIVFGLDINGAEEFVPYVSAIGAANGVVITWLLGWQKYEQREEENLAIDALVENPAQLPPDAIDTP